MSANDPKDLDTACDSETDSGGGAETPAQKLAKLKEELKKRQSEKEQLEKQSAVLKEEFDKKIAVINDTIAEKTKNVAELTKTVGEIDQTVKAWEKAIQALNQHKQEESSYYKLKRPMLEAAVPDREKEFVKKEKREGKAAQAVEALKGRVKTLQEKEAQRSQELAAARAAAGAAQKHFDEVAGLAKTNDEWLKDLKALHDAAEKEDAKNNVSRMYFLILEMEDVLKKLDIPTVEEYTRRANEAKTAAETGKAVEKAAEDALKQTQSDLANAQKELAAAKADRRKKTLEAIPAAAAATVPT